MILLLQICKVKVYVLTSKHRDWVSCTDNIFLCIWHSVDPGFYTGLTPEHNCWLSNRIDYNFDQITYKLRINNICLRQMETIVISLYTIVANAPYWINTLGHTLELRWLEHCWLVYHGCFELFLESLGKKSYSCRFSINLGWCSILYLKWYIVCTH